MLSAGSGGASSRGGYCSDDESGLEQDGRIYVRMPLSALRTLEGRRKLSGNRSVDRRAWLILASASGAKKPSSSNSGRPHAHGYV